MRKCFFLAFSLILFSTSVQAGLVEEYFADLTALRANFVQTVFDEKGKPLEQSSGVMFMLKPNQFRWDYRDPFEQLLVSDGERIWHYDIELEQITVRPLADALGSTPLALLGSGKPLAESFVVSSIGQRETVQWFWLEPKQAVAEFSGLRLGFSASTNELVVFSVFDNQQRETQLRLSSVERNPELSTGLFQFVPPAGVDVIGE